MRVVAPEPVHRYLEDGPDATQGCERPLRREGSQRLMGVLIAIEGIDGAGKRTQADRLLARCREKGRTAGLLSFPRYGGTFTAETIADYLNGRYGSIEGIDSRLPAVLFAVDRLESRAVIRDHLETDDVLICDRYVPSNLAYQGARREPADRDGFFAWLAHLEYDLCGLPRPDVTVFLDIDPTSAAELVARKDARAYTTKAADLHESNHEFLIACRNAYAALRATDFVGAWIEVPCLNPDGTLRDPESIEAQIWSQVAPRLDPNVHDDPR